MLLFGPYSLCLILNGILQNKVVSNHTFSERWVHSNHFCGIKKICLLHFLWVIFKKKSIKQSVYNAWEEVEQQIKQDNETLTTLLKGIHDSHLKVPSCEIFSKPRPYGPMLSISPSVRLSVCSLLRTHLNVFLPPLLVVDCPKFLVIRNPLWKIMERSGLRYDNFD